MEESTAINEVSNSMNYVHNRMFGTALFELSSFQSVPFKKDSIARIEHLWENWDGVGSDTKH